MIIKIELPVYKIIVQFDMDNSMGSVSCDPGIYEKCPHCGKSDCCFQCDDSTASFDPDFPRTGDDEDEVASRLQTNGAIDGVLSMILAHAIAGIDIESGAYLEGIETTFDGISNNS